MTEFAVFLLLPAAFLLAAFSDLTRYTIPNWLTGAIALSFIPVALFAGLAPLAILIHLGVGFVALGIAMMLYAMRWLGGGDAKLIAAAALWAGPTAFWVFLLAAALAGGALTLGLLFFRKLPLPPLFASREWIARLHDPKEGVPYGVALSAGAFYAFPYMTLSQMLGS